MKIVTSIVLSIVVLALPLDANSQDRELLVPVTDLDKQESWAEHEYFLKLNTYWAKRHRLVRVNARVLIDEDQFTIALFDDETITVSRTDLDAKLNGAVFAWAGEIVEPRLTDDDLLVAGIPQDDLAELRQYFVGIKIYASETLVDAATGRKIRPRSFNSSQTEASSRGHAVNFDVNTTINIYGDLFDPTSFRRFDLRPIDDHPQLHLLVEIDADKLFPGGELDVPEDPELQKKRRDYAEFVQSLGPDPYEVEESQERQP